MCLNLSHLYLFISHTFKLEQQTDEQHNMISVKWKCMQMSFQLSSQKEWTKLVNISVSKHNWLKNKGLIDALHAVLTSMPLIYAAHGLLHQFTSSQKCQVISSGLSFSSKDEWTWANPMIHSRPERAHCIRMYNKCSAPWINMITFWGKNSKVIPNKHIQDVNGYSYKDIS